MQVLTTLLQNFKNIKQDPKTFVIIIITVLLLSASVIINNFITSNTKKDEKTLNDCRDSNNKLNDELRAEREEKNDLIKAILVKNGVIDRLTNERDSLKKEY